MYDREIYNLSVKDNVRLCFENFVITKKIWQSYELRLLWSLLQLLLVIVQLFVSAKFGDVPEVVSANVLLDFE